MTCFSSRGILEGGYAREEPAHAASATSATLLNIALSPPPPPPPPPPSSPSSLSLYIHIYAGAQFTCFTSTKLETLTQKKLSTLILHAQKLRTIHTQPPHTYIQELSLLALIVQNYTRNLRIHIYTGAQFTCFTGTTTKLHAQELRPIHTQPPPFQHRVAPAALRFTGTKVQILAYLRRTTSAFSASCCPSSFTFSATVPCRAF